MRGLGPRRIGTTRDWLSRESGCWCIVGTVRVLTPHWYLPGPCGVFVSVLGLGNLCEIAIDGGARVAARHIVEQLLAVGRHADLRSR